MFKTNALALAVLSLTSFILSAAELPEAGKKTLADKYKVESGYDVKIEHQAKRRIYTVTWKDKDGVEHEVGLATDGSVWREFVSVKADDVPKAVKDGIQGKYPNATVKKARLETEKGEQSYDITAKTDTGEVNLKVSADGSKVVKQEKMEGGD